MKSWLMFGAASMLTISSTLAAAPPADEAVKEASSSLGQRIAALRESKATDFAPAYEEARAVVEGWDLSAASLATIRLIVTDRYLSQFVDAANVIAAIDRIAAQTDADGADAAAMALRNAGRLEGEARLAAVKRALEHPALEAAWREGRADGIFQSGSYIRGAEDADLFGPALLAAARRINGETSAKIIVRSADAVNPLARFDSGAVAETREALRSTILGHLMRLKDQGAESLGELAKSVDRQIAWLNGRFAKGQLANQAAAPIEFLWFSGSGDAKRLSDLKGKVVMIDFWATWCGPCRATFPNVRELQKHYEGAADVVIVGLTSIQGKHYGKGDPVDTAGKPDLEFSLMKEFMTDNEMTWPVAFSSTDVFNPDYGVRGIPSVVIIDPQGVVRHYGLHAGHDLEELIAKIDALRIPSP